MKILVFGLGPILGGVEKQFYNNYYTLKNNGIKCDFVTPYNHMAYGKEFEDSGSKVYKVSNLKRRPARYAHEIRTILQKGGYDGVYVNMLSAANIVPLKLAKQHGVPIVIAHAHNDHVPAGLLRKVLHSRNVDSIPRYANAYFACSKAAGHWLFPNIDQEEVVIVPNAIPADAFMYDEDIHRKTRERYGITPDTFLLGHVGRFQEQKNHEFIARLFKRYHDVNAQSKLMLVGEGELREKIRAQLCADGLQDDVIFVDPTNVIEQYYMAFDCFVFPSLFEGLSVAGLEAQAAGLPVLASDALTKELNVTGAVEYLPLSDMGIWVDALDKLHGHCKDSERVTERRVLQGRSFDKTKYSLSQSNLYLVDTISELAARNGIREC